MQKPIIAIFLVGNLPTKEEQQLINSLAHYPCVLLNAETYTPQESLVVDAVVGVVPKHLEHLPNPDTVIKAYEAYLDGTGNNVGGNPPKAPEQPPPPPNTGFGTPPTIPEQPPIPPKNN